MSIRIVTMQFGNLPYFEAATKILQMYCTKFKYELVIVGKEERSDRHGVWSKINGIKAALKGVDFVFYIDADAVIIDHSVALSGFERMMKPEHLFLLGQGHVPGLPNTGTMLVRSCDETKVILDKWNDSSAESDYANKYPWDEAAFHKVIMREYKKCVLMPSKGALNWVDGKFIRHYMGGDTYPERKADTIQKELNLLFNV